MHLGRMKSGKGWLVLAVLVLLYAVAGFFAAPGVIRTQLIRLATEKLGRPPVLGKVAVNPFALSVTLRGGALEGPAGDRLAGIEELHVDFAPLGSLFRRAWSFSEIRLRGPSLQVEIRPDRRLNLADLAWAAKAPAETSAAVRDTARTVNGVARGLPPLFIQRLRILDGTTSGDHRGRSWRFVRDPCESATRSSS